jgi:hypothetical protein
MNMPTMLGRHEDDLVYERASTRLAASIDHEFVGHSTGGSHARVELFVSNDWANRGGAVLRLRVDQPDGGTFVPMSKNIDNGVELYLAGDEEADVFIMAVQQALAAWRTKDVHVDRSVVSIPIPPER